MNEIEKKAEELAAEMKSAKKTADEALAKYESLKTQGDATTEELKRMADEVKRANDEVKSIGDALNAMNTKLEAIKSKNDKEEVAVSIKAAIDDLFNSEQFKSDMASNSRAGSAWGKTYELKASTADIVTPVALTQMIPGVQWKRERSLAFIPNTVQASVGQDKNRIAYIEADYTSHVGYVGEGQANGTSDSVSAVEKYRSLAKISAILPVTAEMLEDTDFIASQLETQMAGKAMLFLDKEIYKGDGDDKTNPNHFYGLLGAATDFSATKSGVATAIETPTAADLVASVKLQGQVIDATDDSYGDHGGFNIDVVFINPVDAMKWRHTKAKDGNYVLTTLADGSQVMGGVRVVETKAVEANTLLAMESGIVQLFMKRNMEIKIGQEKDDLSTDRYTIVLFMRAQTLVYDNDKLGIIKVSDIESALTAIAKPTA